MGQHSSTERSRATCREDVETVTSRTAQSRQLLPEVFPESGRAWAICRRELAAALGKIHELEEAIRLSVGEMTLLRREAAEASECAYRDALTGLPNRRLLLDRFAQAVKQAERHHHQVALLFLDLDGFKAINDSLGHAAGDDLLQQVAARLTGCIRTSDTACRYGGDEFVVVLPEFTSHDCVATAADKIRARLAMPYVVDGAAIELTASVGAAVYPVDGSGLCDLIQASDRAMYRSKARSSLFRTVLPLRTDEVHAQRRSSHSVGEPEVAFLLRE